MVELWAREHPVACVHPGWRALHGRDEVLASWRAILQGEGSPEVACGSPRVQLLGETAFVTCTEQLPGALLTATNVFIREQGAWKLVHHHAGPTAREGENVVLDLDRLN